MADTKLPDRGVVTLKFPFKHGGLDIEKVSFRRPKMRDQMQKAKRLKDGMSDLECEILMFADLAEVTPDVIEEMDEVDYTAMQETYQGFFPPKPKPGKSA